jgi:hypothetical protein
VDARLRLDLFDAYGDPIKERVDIYLDHQTLSEKVAARSVDTSQPVTITGLRGAPQGLYKLFIDPPSYLPVSVFVNLKSTGVTDRALPFAVDPDKVIRVNFPEYSSRKLDDARRLLDDSSVNGSSGEALYQGLDDIRRAGLLNVLAKSSRTPLTGGGVVIEFLRKLLRIEGDRSFASVAPDLCSKIKSSVTAGTFTEVSGALHQFQDYSCAGSYKTVDSYGNLQLTFFRKDENWVVDVDIDDAAGLGHVFQVVRNGLTGRPTHPYNIHDILVRYQEIDPGYRFVLYEESANVEAV